MAPTGDDVLQGLAEKLKAALEEVQQIKDSLLGAPETEWLRESLRRGGEVAVEEASQVYERLGRETYELVKAGKVVLPDVVRDAFERAERSLERFAADRESEGPPVEEPPEAH